MKLKKKSKRKVVQPFWIIIIVNFQYYNYRKAKIKWVKKKKTIPYIYINILLL